MGVVLVLDQLTKAVVRSELALYESTVVIPGVFDLTRIHNTGAAFGLMNLADFRFKAAILALVAALALTGLAVYSTTMAQEQWLSRLGLAGIMGGAVGNLIDRVSTGYVLDFVDVYWGNWHFWAFNVADAAISVGVALMILDLLRLERHRVSRTL